MLQSLVATIANSEARAHFVRARRAYRTARARRMLTARRPGRTRPRDLESSAALIWRTGRLRAIPLELIVGTVDPTPDFDAEFRPTTDRVASRWQSIAHATLEGRRLPPIEVIERPDGYYVVDGRHRVSVARALDWHEIDARTSPVVDVPRARPVGSSTSQGRPIPSASVVTPGADGPQPSVGSTWRSTASASESPGATQPAGRPRASTATRPRAAAGPVRSTSCGRCACRTPARSSTAHRLAAALDAEAAPPTARASTA
jgi:hypothetical protein